MILDVSNGPPLPLLHSVRLRNDGGVAALPPPRPEGPLDCCVLCLSKLSQW